MACSGGEPVPQDGLGEPVHHQPALVDPGQRLPGPDRARVCRQASGSAARAASSPRQFAGRAGEQVLGDRLGGQERAQAGQLRGGRIIARRAGPRSARSRQPATADTTRAPPDPAASPPGCLQQSQVLGGWHAGLGHESRRLDYGQRQVPELVGELARISVTESRNPSL